MRRKMSTAVAVVCAAGWVGQEAAWADDFLPAELPAGTNLVVCADGAPAAVFADGHSFRTARLGSGRCVSWSVGPGPYKVGLAQPAGAALRFVSVTRAPGEQARIRAHQVSTWVAKASRRPSLGPHDDSGKPTGPGINVTLVVFRSDPEPGGGQPPPPVPDRDTGAGPSPDQAGQGSAVGHHHTHSDTDPGFDPSNDPAHRKHRWPPR